MKRPKYTPVRKAFAGKSDRAGKSKNWRNDDPLPMVGGSLAALELKLAAITNATPKP